MSLGVGFALLIPRASIDGDGLEQRRWLYADSERCLWVPIFLDQNAQSAFRGSPTLSSVQFLSRRPVSIVAKCSDFGHLENGVGLFSRISNNGCLGI